jgi:OOP family OmpA-OmpF porin
MNKKLLCAALLGGLGVAQAASAQTFDDRWYITGTAGMNMQDNDRGTHNKPFGAIGFGKFFNPNWSFDVEANYQKPTFEGRNNIVNPNLSLRGQDLNWSQYGISFDVRRHFTAEGRSWNPYVLMGLGYQRNEEEFDAYPNPDSPGQRKDGNLAAKVGVGMQGDLGRVGIRTELAYRADFDGNSHFAPDESWFGDVLASVGVVIPLGPEPMAAVAPAPVAPNCADSDSDGDGVNDCDDKCPGSQAGQTIGPDGCPVPVSIDLKVEVAGHTDSIGTDAYNQGLSERRARAVYDYLTSNGIDASRLVGPNGYGESRPIAPNTNPDGSDNPEGRALNRRTELNVQN